MKQCVPYLCLRVYVIGGGYFSDYQGISSCAQ